MEIIKNQYICSTKKYWLAIFKSNICLLIISNILFYQKTNHIFLHFLYFFINLFAFYLAHSDITIFPCYHYHSLIPLIISIIYIHTS